MRRDQETRPEAIARTLRLWLPPGSRVYIGSTEPPAFFAPLRRSFRLHFAEDFGRQLSNITNNYALYAVETLVFFASQMSVESLSFQSSWFVDACFPAISLRGRASPRMPAHLLAAGMRARSGLNTSALLDAGRRGPHAGAVDIQW